MSSSISLEYLNNAINELPGRTQSAICAQNIAGTPILIAIGGTAIPLAERPYVRGFTFSADNRTITVTQSGVYMLSYSIQVRVAMQLSSTVNRNGASMPNLVRSPGFSENVLACSAILPLSAGDALQLMLYGIGALTELQPGVGAYLNVMRIA